jgi:hypothetical protein
MNARPRPRDHAIAAAIFLVASAVTWASVWSAGPSRVAAVHATPAHFRPTIRADVTYEAWLVSRHAHTLMHRPWRIFDTEHCAPAQKTLTLGIPMLTLGLLAVPAAVFSDEPVWIYNASLVLLGLVGAFAMYLLVARWTGVPAAGWVAGLLFGFMPVRLAHVTHPSVWDISWTVFALYFAERFSARGRWRDALGLGLSIALQVGASFYPLLAAACLAPPFGVWLLLRDRLRALRPGPVALLLGLALLAVLVVLVPYLGVETDIGGLVRWRFHYLDPSDLLRPAQPEFPGWSVYALALVGLCCGARRSTPGIPGDPRWALLAGALLVGLVASGPGHAWLAGFVPGLASIRGVARLVSGIELVAMLLAGLGAGVLVRAAGRRGAWVAAALLAVAAADVLRLPVAIPGLAPRPPWRLEEIRPDDASIAFFRELERQGNRGPLLELPLGDRRHLLEDTSRILLAGYHGRRTSACFGSYRPPGREALEALASRLPAERSVRELRALGFTTVLVHTSPGFLPTLRLTARLARAAEAPDAPIALVAMDERHAAFQLTPRPEREPQTQRGTGGAQPR